MNTGLEADNQEQQSDGKYIIGALRDACEVIEKMMRELKPDSYYSVADIGELLPNLSGNKIYRILKTFESMGWVEVDPQAKARKPRYKIGHPLMMLSHKYMQKLRDEHLRIVQEVNRFNI